MYSTSKEGGEGTSDTFEYGYHNHKVGMPPCGVCELENIAFTKLVSDRGAHAVENRMHSQHNYRAYNQKWPFDARKNVLSRDEMLEDGDNGYIDADGSSPSALDAILEHEAAEELLAELSEREKFAMQRKAEGYKPRETAALKGEANSSRVRQDLYAGMRKLGAPVNEKMRRTKE